MPTDGFNTGIQEMGVLRSPAIRRDSETAQQGSIGGGDCKHQQPKFREVSATPVRTGEYDDAEISASNRDSRGSRGPHAPSR